MAAAPSREFSYAFVAENQIPPSGSGRLKDFVTPRGDRIWSHRDQIWTSLVALLPSVMGRAPVIASFFSSFFPHSGEANGRFATNWVAWPWTVAIASGRKGGSAMDGSHCERLEGRLCHGRGAVDGLDAVPVTLDGRGG